MMLTILCEVTSEPPGMAFMAGIAASMVIIVKGIELLTGRLRRNGNGRDCCHGKGCERLARVETKQDSFEKWLEKVEAKLDRVLER